MTKTEKKLIRNEMKRIFDRLLLLLQRTGSGSDDCTFLSVDDCVVLVAKNCNQEESDYLRKTIVDFAKNRKKT